MAQHTHDVYDTGKHFEINGISRFIKETSATKLVLVQGDHNSEVITFQMPRYIDGHDMLLCNKIRVHYINLDTKTNDKSADIYEVTDLALCEECEEETLTFTWKIEAPATKYYGSLAFLIKFECTEGDSILYQWNTARYVGVNVLDGIDNSEEFVEKYSNVLEEWYNELTKGADSIEELNQQAIAEIELAKEDAKEDIQGKADATMDEMNQFSSNAYNSFKNDVDEKAARTLESIPEDYSDMDAEVKELKSDITTVEKTMDDVIPSTIFSVGRLNDSSYIRNGYWKNNNGVAVYTETSNLFRAVNAQDIEGCFKVIVENLNQNTAISQEGFQSIFVVDKDYKILIAYTNTTDGYFNKELFVPYDAKYLLLSYYNVSNSLSFCGYKFKKTVDKDGITETLFDQLLLSANGNSIIPISVYETNKWWTAEGNNIASKEGQHNNAKRAVIHVNQKSFYKIIFNQYQFNITDVKALYLCDENDNIIKSYPHYPDGIFDIPYGTTKIYINFWYSYDVSKLYVLVEYSQNSLLGKNVAIIGDSISTNGNSGTDKNAVEITISEADVGKTLSAYPTMHDVNAKLTLGGHSFTASDVGSEYTFIPTSDDVGKVIGLPDNYNNNSNLIWWEVAKDYFGFNPIPVCWSGSSIARHENETANPELKCSYAWHESQIRKCGIRIDGTMERIAPDVIIVYRGCNDMTHSPYSRITSGYFDNVNFAYPTDDTLADGTHGFLEGYVLLISKLREAYPNAKIVLCTLTVFKRVNFSHFPTNNGLYTLPQINNAIRQIADYMGCGLIEFDKCGITFENCYSEGYITDSATTPTHPSKKGHIVIGMKAIEDLKRI